MPKPKASSVQEKSKNVTKKLMRTSGSAFETLYKNLNEHQKEAVDTIDGPVMVVAGPGTGKTQVLALRTANILRKTQMRPSNILCLTFSKSGATAMRDRLRSIIGSDAYSITIDTIHGFCNNLIVSHPQIFENWSSLNQISDVERYREVNKIIDQILPHSKLLNLKSPYSRTKEILARISQLKREGVVGDDTLEEVADAYDQQMSAKSREGTKAHEKNVLQAIKFREFLRIFHAYQAMLNATSRYDYEDMILYVLDALKENDFLLAGLQERYQYILVDEAQDLNGAQFAFINLITDDPTGDNLPNLFIVGDDDQAIYRFQGANVLNLLSFHERFPDAPVIPLTVSYRSSQDILTAASTLIENNTDRLMGSIDGLEKNLQSGRKSGGAPPALLLAASDMAEPWLVADLLEERLKEGMDPNDIAVITQTNRELNDMYDVLTARGIPSKLSGKLDLLSHPLIEQTIAILKAVHTPEDSAALASALSCECFACHPADLAELFSMRREQNATLLSQLLRIDTDDIPFRNTEALLHARDVLLALHQKKEQRTVVSTVEHLYRNTGLLDTYKKGDMDVIDFAAGQEFFDRIKARASEYPSFTFEALMSDLEFYGNPDYSDVRLSYDLPHLTENGVELMTAHRSKGLEFETVILTNFREGHWDKRRNPPSISIPEDLLFSWEKEEKRLHQQNDERRVAYVAFTRAKRELIFTAPLERTTGDSMKSVSVSGFFAEAGDLPEQKRDVRDPGSMSTLLSEPSRSFDAEFETFLKRKIEHFSLSPTALHHFLEDPLLFLDVDLLEKPQAKEPHFAYGNAVHHVLAKWALSVQEGNPLSKDTILEEFTKHVREREILTEKQRERLLYLGEESLPRYIDTNLQPPYPVIHRVEFPITTRLGDIPIKGKLDRIDLLEPNSAACIVTDFKTGKPKTEKQIMEYGYHRQLVFYALLIEHGYPQLSPQEFVLDFLGEGSEEGVRRVFEVTSGEKKELSDLISKVWEKILALDFTPLEISSV